MANQHRDFPRHYRVADQIQRDLAQILSRELKDSRVPTLLTVTEVSVSRDLSVATIYVSTVLEIDRAALIEALAERAGFIRSLLGSRLRLRSVPSLRFRYDDTNEQAMALSRVIDAAVDRDRARSEGES